MIEITIKFADGSTKTFEAKRSDSQLQLLSEFFADQFENFEEE